ncbi:MAG: hypothetical protein MJK12_15520 [Colwellia sp.]|nr:hypothetical protein [Colwellia sp.]
MSSVMPTVEFMICVNNEKLRQIFCTYEEAKRVALDYANNDNKVWIETVNGEFKKWELN